MLRELWLTVTFCWITINHHFDFQSLRSKGYVKEQFAWQHYYWYLENDGITFLRDYLHLPQEIVPSTLKRPTARTTTAPPKPKPQGNLLFIFYCKSYIG